MATDLLFIHSAGSQAPGSGSSQFLAWLKAEFANKFNIIAPAMPNTENPSYQEWSQELSRLFAQLGDRAVVVGHSLGGSSVVKYLSENTLAKDIQGLFVVAAPYWGADSNWNQEDFKFRSDEPAEIDKAEKIYFYHSKADDLVPFQHQGWYSQKFPLSMAISVEGVSHLFAEPVAALLQDMETMESS